jgi:hypothetical protein
MRPARVHAICVFDAILFLSTPGGRQWNICRTSHALHAITFASVLSFARQLAWNIVYGASDATSCGCAIRAVTTAAAAEADPSPSRIHP